MSVTPLSDYTWPDGTIWPPQPGGLPDAAGSLADFGAGIANVDVDAAVLGTLQTWLPTYLRALKQQRDLGFDLPVPASWASTVDEDQFMDGKLPAVLVATARTQGELVISEDGRYITTWLVAVSTVVRGRRPPETRVLAGLYELAVRKVMVHKGDLGGFAAGTRWVGGGQAVPLVDRNSSGKGRWLGEGASQYWVFTDNAVQENAGPLEPDREPYADLATVQSVDIDPIEGLPIEPTGESE